MKTMRLVGTFVVLGALLLFFFSTRFEPLPTGTKPPMPQQLPLLSGNYLDTASLNSKPLVINFWATWCPPCRSELPAFVKVAARFKDRVNFLGIAADSPISELHRFQTSYAIPYPIVLGTANLLKAWRVEQFPTTYFLNGAGEVVTAHLGALDEAELTEIVESMLR